MQYILAQNLKISLEHDKTLGKADRGSQLVLCIQSKHVNSFGKKYKKMAAPYPSSIFGHLSIWFGLLLMSIFPSCSLFFILFHSH